MQDIAIKSIHIIILELMNLFHGNTFSPWEDFFVNPFGSDVITPNQLCKCISVQVLVEARGTMNLNRLCSWEV